MTERCPTCKGTGRVERHVPGSLAAFPPVAFPPATTTPCIYCQGAGWVPVASKPAA